MIKNQIKTTILLVVLTGILLILGRLIGGTSGLIIAFIIALIMNFVSYWWSDKIVLFLYRAKEADKKKYSKLYELVREISTRAGIPKPRIFIMESGAANAFATGRNPKHSTVAFTTGILSILSEEELRGVIAHEMSHIKNRDILIGSVVAVVVGTISFIASMARFSAIFGGGRDNNGPSLLEFIFLLVLAPIIATILQLAISRSREYLADESGAKILKKSSGLADALIKLESSAQEKPLGSNNATAHMFIVKPFSGGALLKLFSTHPPIEQRVRKLRSMNY
mgnify:CR=1 FL=1